MSLQKIKNLFCLSLLCATSALSATIWIGPETGAAWNLNTNWEGGVVPNGPTDTATFAMTGARSNINLDVAVVLGTLDVTANYLYIKPNNSLTIYNGVNFNPLGISDSTLYLGSPLFKGDTTTISTSFADCSAYTVLYTSTFESNEVIINGPGSVHIIVAPNFVEGTTLTLNNNGGIIVYDNINVANIVMKEDSSLIVMKEDSSLSLQNPFTVTSNITGHGYIGIKNTSTVNFNPETSAAFSGFISGEGTVTKSGAGTLTLSGTNTYAGTTTVSNGELSVTGTSVETTTTVGASGTLSGNGTVGPVINSGGTVQAGLSPLETFNVKGDFTQSATKTFKALVNGNGTSQLNVTGTAALAGTLELDVGPGAYSSTEFGVVLTATNDITTSFDAITPDSWSETFELKRVTVSPSTNQVVTPMALSTLPTNARNIGEYFFNNDAVTFGSSDLTTVANASLTLPTSGPFQDSLICLSPISQAGNISASYQNNLQMAIVLDRQFQQVAQNQSLSNCSELHYGQAESGGFVQPIALFYNQDQTSDSLATTSQIAFNASTYGVGIGYNYVTNKQFIFEGGIGYTHTNLNWKNNFGSSDWNSLYIAPFFGWFNDLGFANVMFMWAANFYDTSRKIQFVGVNRTAKSSYNSYDYLVRLNGGFQVFLGDGFWFRPEATLNYLADVREEYTETGAAGINLQVKRQVSNILQPSIRARFVKEIDTPHFCYSPNLYVGWLANVPLDDGSISARFTDAPSSLFFNIQGGNQTTNQLVLGAEFFARRFNQFEITTNFEADLLSYLQVYTAKVKFEWMY